MREISTTLKRIQIEDIQKWDDEIDKIPFIKFPSDWEIKIFPPVGGAAARFRVKLPSGNEKSIYLDCWDALGYVGKPYWEVYPYQGDCGRCLVNEVSTLLEMIADESEN